MEIGPIDTSNDKKFDEEKKKNQASGFKKNTLKLKSSIIPIHLLYIKTTCSCQSFLNP